MHILSKQPLRNVSRAPAPVDFDDALIGGMDRGIALILVIFFLPLLGAIALLVKIVDPGPVLFVHHRVGRHGRSFPCLKFRTMVQDADQRLADLLARSAEARQEWGRDWKLREDPRITFLGSFLRRSSLDELPQLFNVLRGEMSLVGPRPIVREEAARYGRYFRHYCSVCPGITGLWQISGRNELSYRRRVALDVVYTRSRSALLNLYILVWTIPCVMTGRGSC